MPTWRDPAREDEGQLEGRLGRGAKEAQRGAGRGRGEGKAQAIQVRASGFATLCTRLVGHRNVHKVFLRKLQWRVGHVRPRLRERRRRRARYRAARLGLGLEHGCELLRDELADLRGQLSGEAAERVVPLLV
jgi:hypothetical protein